MMSTMYRECVAQGSNRAKSNKNLEISLQSRHTAVKWCLIASIQGREHVEAMTRYEQGGSPADTDFPFEISRNEVKSKWMGIRVVLSEREMVY